MVGFGKGGFSWLIGACIEGSMRLRVGKSGVVFGIC